MLSVTEQLWYIERQGSSDASLEGNTRPKKEFENQTVKFFIKVPMNSKITKIFFSSKDTMGHKNTLREL